MENITNVKFMYATGRKKCAPLAALFRVGPHLRTKVRERGRDNERMSYQVAPQAGYDRR